MRYKWVSFSLIIFFLSLTSCSRRFDSVNALQGYIHNEENGLIVNRVVNDFHYQLMYKPTDLLASQELEREYSERELQILRGKYEEFIYFTFSISKDEQELLSSLADDRSQFSAVVNDLVFELNEIIRIVTEKGENLKLVDYIYPRLYGMGSSTDIMLIFSRDEVLRGGEFFRLEIQDNNLGIPEVSFKLKTKSIEKEPGLRL